MILETLKIPHEALASGPRINFPNGSFIQLLGADAINARNRIRGRKFALVIVDEMGFFAEGDQLIYDLFPTLADLSGTICMTSSPGKLLHGIFYEADAGKLRASWSQHHWTLLENPMFMRPASDPKFKSRGEEELHNIVMLQFGGDWNHPDFRREYLGQWAVSRKSMVYPVGSENILNHELQLDTPEYALGIYYSTDSDYAAATVLKFSQYDRRSQFVWAEKRDGATMPQFAEMVQNLVATYKPAVIVGHEGKIGKMTTTEMSARYQIPVQASDIIDKSWYQRVFAGDLQTGMIFIHQANAAILLEEWNKLVKDDNGDEIPGPPNYAANAALAVYKRVYSAFLKAATPRETEEQYMVRRITESARAERDEDDLI